MKGIYTENKNHTNDFFYISDKMKLIRTDGSFLADVLAENVSCEYDIIINGDNLHIVYQSARGELKSLYISPESKKEKTLLMPKSPGQPFNKINIVGNEHTLYCLYILSTKRKKLLILHPFWGKVPPTPVVLSEIVYDNYSSIYLKEENTLCTFYPDKSGNITLNRYDTDYNSYNDEIIYTENHVVDVEVSRDINKNLHLVYVSEKSSYYTVGYINLTTHEKKTLSFGTDMFISLISWCDDSSLHVVWEDNMSIYEISKKISAPSNFSKVRAICKNTSFNKLLSYPDGNISYIRASSLS